MRRKQALLLAIMLCCAVFYAVAVSGLVCQVARSKAAEITRCLEVAALTVCRAAAVPARWLQGDPE